MADEQAQLPCGSCGATPTCTITITLNGRPVQACLRHLNHWRTPAPDYTCPTTRVEQNHPGRGQGATPKRIQRKRRRGWRKPPGAINVACPSKWGNPYRYDPTADVRHELAGRDLMCWCSLDWPCHADVLLEVANEDRS